MSVPVLLVRRLARVGYRCIGSNTYQGSLGGFDERFDGSRVVGGPYQAAIPVSVSVGLSFATEVQNLEWVYRVPGNGGGGEG